MLFALPLLLQLAMTAIQTSLLLCKVLSITFSPKNMRKNIAEYEKVITLEADTDYQFKVDAACESGTIEISLTYENAEEKMYIVNSSAPC